ncbi:MAG: DUF2178 domain-containing protein [Candidatus Nanoarchaeia archaeon]|nr:DUF2178 domain-containing protein [Candidatus Nanoarchaeia archaeon]
MASKKINSKRNLIIKSIFVLVFFITGILLNVFNIGKKDYFGYSSVGSYLIFCSFLLVFIIVLRYKIQKNKIIDERMEKIGYLASRATFSFIFIMGFILMILDGIYDFTWSYSTFISNSIMVILIFYLISYKLIERKL